MTRPPRAQAAPPPPKPSFKLFVCLDRLPDSAASQPAVFFLKPKIGVRLEEENMDSHVDYGVLSDGPALSVLEELLNQARPPRHQSSCISSALLFGAPFPA